MPAIFHINDNNLLLQKGSQQGNLAVRSQGYAWLKDKEVYFDFESNHSVSNKSAVASCRLAPQQINNRYWQQCEQTAVANNDSGIRHSADLIWRHINELKRAHDLHDVVLVVPSHYQESNLELLLGIANACELNVVGLVNKAVLSLHNKIERDGDYLHVDVQLHQTVCSQITVNKQRLTLGRAEILHDVGLQVMQDSLLKAIQHNFIQRDRFDPLHYAETEQQLFDQLPQLAKKIATQNKVNVAVEYETRLHSTSIDQKQWADALQAYFATLSEVKDSQATLYSFNCFNPFTGIEQFQALSDVSFVIPLNEIQAGQMTGQGLVYCTELTVASNGKTERPPTMAASTVSVNSISVPLTTHPVTHLLQSGEAVAIANAMISVSDNQLSLQYGDASNIQSMLQSKELFLLNDSGRTSLQVNDRLGSNLADGVVTAINVLERPHKSVMNE